MINSKNLDVNCAHVMFVKFCLGLKDFKIENVNYQVLLSKVQSPKQYLSNKFYNLYWNTELTLLETQISLDPSWV